MVLAEHSIAISELIYWYFYSFSGQLLHLQLVQSAPYSYVYCALHKNGFT